MFYYHDWQGAQDGYRRAIALNPNYATAHHWYSEYLTAMGRFDEAFVEIRRAKEIDPLSPGVNAQEVWILFYARRYDEAIERGLRIAEMNPDFAEIYDPLKRCYDQKGMYRGDCGTAEAAQVGGMGRDRNGSSKRSGFDFGCRHLLEKKTGTGDRRSAKRTAHAV